jgi:hypothetical protein
MVLNLFLRREVIDNIRALLKGEKEGLQSVLADRKSFHPKTLKSMIRQSGLTEEEFFWNK